MKKLFLAVGITGLLFILAYAAKVHTTQDSEVQTGTYYSTITKIPNYQHHIYAVVRVTSTPPTTGVVDSIKITLQTRRDSVILAGDYAGVPEAWLDLYTMTAGVDDTITLEKWFLADSLALSYKLGKHLRFEVVLSDTITADTAFTDDPWTWTAMLGFQ